MPDYEYTDISLKDFLAALEIYLGRLQQEAKANTPVWDKIAWTLAPSKFTGIESINERFDRIYNEILNAVDLYGLSPEVAQSLPPDAAQIFSVTLQKRAGYEWDKQYKGDLDKWAQDVVKAQAQASQDWVGQQRWEYDVDWQRRKWAGQEEWKRWQAEGAGVDLQNKMNRLQWERDMALRGLRDQAATQRLIAGAAGMWQQPEPDRAKAWESARREILGQLTSPIDWIKKWQVKQMTNPYEKKGEDDWTAESHKYEEEAASYKPSYQAAKELEQEAAKDPNKSLTPQEKQWVDIAKIRYQTARNKMLESQEKAEEAKMEWSATMGADYPSPGVYSGAGSVIPEAQPKITTPQTPEWLAEMYPGMGANIPKKTEIGQFAPAPMSGQWMSRALPSEMAGYMGYVEYAGGSPEDIMWQSQQMLPRPRAGTRWQPARQRVSI